MILKINDRIRNRKVQYFDKFNLNLKYDSMGSTFDFSMYYNPDNPEQKDMLCVGHDHIATLEHNGQLLLTGYILSQVFNDGEKKELAQLGGYSLPGVLEDCQISPDSYPLQNDGLTLREITRKLIAPFGLQMVVAGNVSAEMDKAYEKTTAEPTQTIKDYICSLASQRNIIVTHNEKGHLIFTKANVDQMPILNYDGQIPFTKMSLQFNGQGMHSHIWVIKQADSKGGNAGQSMVRNPYVPFVYRPLVAIQNSGDDVDTEEAAKNILAGELQNLRLVIESDRWDIQGKVIVPNKLITVKNDDIYLFKKSTWFIEQVDYVGSEAAQTLKMTCCLPEVYSGRTPTYLFKGINLH